MMTYSMSPKVKQRLAQPQRLLIDGQWSLASDGRVSEVFNPSSGEVIATAAKASASDTERAVAAARRSFDAGNWARLTPAQRGKILWRIGDLLEQYGDEMAELEMLDAGKPFSGTRHGEIPFAADCFRYYAGWCTKIEGATKQLSTVPDQDFHIYTRREPIGVAALIVPWNGPLVQAAWKIAPALAAGCSCVVKPATQTPLSTVCLAELMLEAGVPAGVINILLGSGSSIGQLLAEHPSVDKVSFTGSTEVGKRIIDAAKGNLKKVSLELGGKSPMIIYEDANLDEAIDGAARAIFSHAGQVCVAGSRLYVHESIYERVVQGVADIASRMTVGPATEPGFDMGPLISKGHLNSVFQKVEAGRAEGARVAAGGQLINKSGGYFMQPTVLADTDHSMSVVNEEIFGPVLVVMPFKTMEEVVAMANDSQYGLAASIWTQDISKAHKTAAAIKAGILWINCHAIPDMAVPFGGYKQSGWGRENGYEALLQYTELKSVIAKL
ncbi:MAG: aldehyde dehydrogenase family protein [Pseudomonadales bacterium]|nr:aldehyde dehydrogenase family protein [Pseudomonadales bacterium]